MNKSGGIIPDPIFFTSATFYTTPSHQLFKANHTWLNITDLEKEEAERYGFVYYDERNDS